MINCMGVIVVRLIYCCPSECSESFWLRCVAPSPGERLSQHSTTRHWRYPSMPCQRTSKTVISAWRLVRFLWRHPPFATLCRAMFDSLVLPLHTLLRRNWKLLCSLLHTYSVTWRQRLCILGLYSAIEIVLLLLLLLLLTHGDVYTLQPPTPSSFRRPVSLSLSLSLCPPSSTGFHRRRSPGVEQSVSNCRICTVTQRIQSTPQNWTFPRSFLSPNTQFIRKHSINFPYLAISLTSC